MIITLVQIRQILISLNAKQPAMQHTCRIHTIHAALLGR